MVDIKQKCKLIKGLLNNPKNVRFKDVERLLKAFGYEVNSQEVVVVILFTEKRE